MGQSTLDAIHNYSLKQLKKDSNTAKRKNKAPEKEVEKEVIRWLRQSGFVYFVAESKATFNPKVGRYVSQSLAPGVSDIIATAPDGTACFIELKAPGKLKTLRQSQKAFLRKQAHNNAFAVVVDSSDLLASLYGQFMNLRFEKKHQDFLLNFLS